MLIIITLDVNYLKGKKMNHNIAEILSLTNFFILMYIVIQDTRQTESIYNEIRDILERELSLIKYIDELETRINNLEDNNEETN